MRIAITDVDYRPDHALAACLVASAFDAPRPSTARTVRVSPVAAYEPGAFYKRELPCLTAVLDAVGGPFDAVVIDGYVWLGDDGQKGLGAHLYEALDRRVPVIGVAKTSFAGSPFAERVTRGLSRSPLFVTAVGVDAKEAAALVAAMHGAHRIPSLLKEVDRLARS